MLLNVLTAGVAAYLTAVHAFNGHAAVRTQRLAAGGQTRNQIVWNAGALHGRVAV